MYFIRLGTLITIPIALAAVPTSTVEGAPTLCIYKNVFGVECPGCGMTRAISCVFHCDFAGAWRYNKLVVIVLPMLAYYWLRFVAGDLRRVGKFFAAKRSDHTPR